MSAKKDLKFLHITKNAGTTIEELSKGTLNWGKYDEDLQDSAGNALEFWHIPVKFHNPAKFKRISDLHDFFIIVRNPYDRLISEYYCEWGGPKKKAETASEFNSFITDRLEEMKELVEMGVRLHGHYVPQYLYMFDPSGKRIVPEENIVHFEYFDLEFNRLMDRYRIQKSVRLSRNNRRNVCRHEKKFGTADLSTRNIKLVQKVFKRDFEFFGYESMPPTKETPAEVLDAVRSSSSVGGSVFPLQISSGAAKLGPAVSLTVSTLGDDQSVCNKLPLDGSTDTAVASSGEGESSCGYVVDEISLNGSASAEEADIRARKRSKLGVC